MDIQAKMLLKT